MAVTAKPVPAAAPVDADIPDVPIYRLTVEQYHAMARAGILTEDDPVELLEGWLVRKMTKYPPHTLVTHLLRRALERLLPEGWFVSSQEPIALDTSEPEPDIFIVRGEPRDYRDRHPGPGDVLLVIEVADTSIRQDRGAKKRVYARAGIPIYWIANLKKRHYEVYTEPWVTAEKADYRERRDYPLSDAIPVLLERTDIGTLEVRDLLP
jgi:Uma2 family endonuclease